MMYRVNVLAAFAVCIAAQVLAKCYDPSPAFLLPSQELFSRNKSFFASIDSAIDTLVTSDLFNGSSFAIEVTSSHETLWSRYHTAKVLNKTRGTRHVDGDTRFRIASITKTFTTLALLQQHAAGNLSIDDTFDKYIHELQDKDEFSIPWKDITLRSLASQLSGIPRELSFDLLPELPDPSELGLPVVSREGLPACDQYVPSGAPCQRSDLIARLKRTPPLFAPNQKSTYSNVAFELLGLAVENVTGLPYEDVLTQNILKPVGMGNTSITKPDDSTGAIPNTPDNAWDYRLGVQAPTGALYTSPLDMSKYLRHILTHYNGLTPTSNWFQPASYASSASSFYGMPWEIFRTTSILDPNTRPTTFITKGGNLSGYASMIFLLPDYDIGITLLVAGSEDTLTKLRETVTVPLVRAVDELIAADAEKTYAGLYIATGSTLNTSLTLTASAAHGLEITSFISNSTDALSALAPLKLEAGLSRSAWRAQLVPTFLYKNQSAVPPAGELWRLQMVSNKDEDNGPHANVWDDECITDEDWAMYAGIPLTEFVMWRDEEGRVMEVEASGFRVKMRKQEEKEQKQGWSEMIEGRSGGSAQSVLVQ